ncbi:RAD50-interacting protein 1 isoform X2 [Epargyreus clarus]|uniref:RAD50-interacting protein 1 isoform X2 n=1 Tax=Epargyreus clarus TaxID=520877 RepID=UPI003C2B5976
MDEEEKMFSAGTCLTDEVKKSIINDLNSKIGGEVENLANVYQLENELGVRRDQLRGLLNAANNEVPTKLSTAIKKAEANSDHIENLKERSEKLKKKAEDFLARNEVVLSELNARFTAVHKLQEILTYFKSYAKVEEISNQLKQCKDDEQMVSLYNQLMEMCEECTNPHRSAYVKETTHYWHNVLKDHLTKSYEDVMKQLKWPFSSEENVPIPNEVLTKFSNLTKYLFMIREPDAVIREINLYEDLVLEPCLPVKILLRPLRRRFIFHFTGTRQTARIDRPEWFLTQTLTWIKDHQKFVRTHIQPVADKLKMKHVHAVAEFNSGLVALAAERLHTVLALYQGHGPKGEIEDVDAAFAHAVDETLGFYREQLAVTGYPINNVLSVLTKAETFVRWLAVEKKYALTKMDETLDNDQWIEAVATGVGSAVGCVLWVPRGADWFISLLKTMEDRYFILPQPGHRLQFLELQLELIDEWRIRLTQLLTVAIDSIRPETFLVAEPNLLIAIVNTAHHVRTVLLLWTHSLQYLQLHYYRSQFHNFTRQQHRDISEHSSVVDEELEEDPKKNKEHIDGTMYLKDVEVRARKLAISDLSKQSFEDKETDFAEQNLTLTAMDQADDTLEDGGAFGEAPALLATLRDAGLAALVEHILFEFKATTREYKKQKWHAMPTVEQKALSVSGPLCAPLAALCARRAAAARALAPRLAETLRVRLAHHVDNYLFEEVCLASWFNTGGALQLAHDARRCVLPAFAPPVTADVVEYKLMPRLLEGCRLLNMDYDDARRLRTVLSRQLHSTLEDAQQQLSGSLLKPQEVRQILSQRTDMKDSSPESVMELF